MPKLLMVVNEDRFFLSHRKPVAIAAREEGYQVTIVAKDTGKFAEIRQLGFDVIDLPINPTGMNLREEWNTFRFLHNLYQKERPDIVHHVGLKNILWGGLAARMLNVPGVVNAVSGLGGLFNGGKISATTRGILTLMRFSNHRRGVKVIFQNNDDMSIFLANKVVTPKQIAFTKGSGIDLNEYTYCEEPENGKIRIIFTGRMVREKGVCDLIEAAELLKPDFDGKVEFILCGRLTPNKTGVTAEYLDSHCHDNYMQWLGERNDIHDLLKSSHIMAFPSYYREGVPKSLIEASAIGRPIVTCNSTGCKDVVTDGVNGYLIEPRTPVMLAEKLRELIENKSLRVRMGKAAREIAEKEFSIDTVVKTHIDIYNTLISQ